MDLFFGWFYRLMYRLQKTICYLIDFVCKVFNKLIGLDTVTIDGENTDLLTSFLTSPSVRNAFFGVMLVGVILLAVFIIIAFIRSEYQEGNAKRTKGQILTKAFHSFLLFIILPIIFLAAIIFTGVIMQAIDTSMTMTAAGGSGNSLFGGQILITSGYDAYIGPPEMRTEIEQAFINGTLDYNSLSVVQQYYDLSEMNFFIGIVSGLILLVLFAIAVIVFIQRIFDIILLYIISPVSISTIPVDDGNRFKIWREMAVAKILGAYGIILAMNLFFIIVPQLTSIRFFDSGFQNGIIQLLIIIGGAFAVTKANIVISQLTGNNAGQQEIQQMMGTVGRGYRMARGAVLGAAALTGRVIGGTDFRNNQRHGTSFSDNVEQTIHSKRNRHEVAESNSNRSAAQKAAAVTRLATLPVGVLKDAIQGGWVTAGRNFVPRLKNVATGSSLISHADVKPKSTALPKETSKSDSADKPNKPVAPISASLPEKDKQDKKLRVIREVDTEPDERNKELVMPSVVMPSVTAAPAENKKSGPAAPADGSRYLRKTYSKEGKKGDKE